MLESERRQGPALLFPLLCGFYVNNLLRDAKAIHLASTRRFYTSPGFPSSRMVTEPDDHGRLRWSSLIPFNPTEPQGYHLRVGYGNGSETIRTEGSNNLETSHKDRRSAFAFVASKNRVWRVAEVQEGVRHDTVLKQCEYRVNRCGFHAITVFVELA